MSEQAMPATPGAAVVFFHAHPDDEAIFTGGTMALLAAAGWRVVLVLATRGELGVPGAGAARQTAALAEQRAEETISAASVLGVARVEFMGHHDSGMVGTEANTAPGAFCRVDTEDAARWLAGLLGEERATALVVYDESGIYGHPDHLKVHEVGVRAASLSGLAILYEVTVDREYLHFVETHLVVEARGGGLGLASSPLGVPTVLVSTTVDVRPVLGLKRAAMAAHGSQIPETASAMRLPVHAFAAVYGFEWYLRTGPPGPIEAVA